MPINVVCGDCGNKYRVPDKFAGRLIPCKGCGADIDVPGDNRDRATSRSSRGRGSAKEKKRGGGLGIAPVLIGVGVVGVLAIGGGIWGAFSLLKRPGNHADGFAPGGVAIDTNPNANAAPAPAGSRFDTPVTGKSVVPQRDSQSGTNLKANQLVGTGFGNTVGITDFWGRQQATRAGSEHDVFQDEPDALPPEVWTLQVDPPPEPLDFEAVRKKLRVKVPVAGNRTTAGAIVFPVVPSRFLAVGENAKKTDVREIWDLSVGKKVSKVSNLNVETADVALSPDGRYFAGVMDAGFAKGSYVGVYDIEEQEIVGNIELEDKSTWISIAMPRPDLLLAMSSFGGRSVHGYEIPSQDRLYSIDIGHPTWNRFPPVFSPGGRYMAWTYREFIAETIAVYDLDEGQLVGKMALPEYPINSRLFLHGLAFSPDGAELAAIVDGSECSKIIMYSMATGEIVDHMTFSKKLQSVVTGDDSPWNSYNPLVYFPGNQRLLAFEHGVIDRGVGEVVFSVPQSLVNFPGKRWPLDPSHLTVIDVAANSASVFLYELPDDKIAKATERFAGRKKKKSEVPSNIARVEELAPTDESQTRQIVAATVDWTLKPDGSTPKTAESNPIALRRGNGTIQQFAVSGGESPKAAVMRGSGWPFWKRIPQGNVAPSLIKSNRESAYSLGDPHRMATGFGSGKSRCWLDLYDLVSGKISRQIRLAYDADLISISPDGSRALLWADLSQDRLDVYDTSDGSLVASWEPEGGVDAVQHLIGAKFIDAERICTMNGIGQLGVWRIVTGSGQPSVVKELTVWNASHPAVDPQGRLLGYSDGASYQIIDVASGEVRGQIPDVGDVHGAAFHRNGTKLALLSEYKGGYYLFTIDLTEGQVSPPFPVPVLTPFLEWFGDKYVLLDNRKLVDVEQKVVAWSYELSDGDHLPACADGRHWFIASSGSSDSPEPILASVELPTSDAAAQLKGAVLGPEFALQPGGSCSLSLQLGPVNGAAEEIRKQAATALGKHKVTIADNQQVTLVLSVTESIGETVQKEYSPIGFGENQTVSHTSKQALCKVQYQTNGEVAWEQTTTVWNESMFVSTSENQSIGQAIESKYHGSVKYFFSMYNLPPYVFTPKASNGIGTTQLAAGRR